MKTIHYYLISFFILFLLSLLIGKVWNAAVSPALRSLPRSVKVSFTQTRTTLPNTPPQKNAFLPIENNQNPQAESAAGENSAAILPAAAPHGALPAPQDRTGQPYAELAQNANEAPSTVAQKENGTMTLEKPSQEIGILTGGQYPTSGKAEDLYKASLPAVKAIIAAQKEYFAKNNKYTINPQDLNLEFKDLEKTVNTDTRTALQFNNGFTFILGSGFLGIIYSSPALPASQLYNIDFFYSSGATCYARTFEAGQSCRALGGDFPRANKMLPNIIEYQLPRNLKINL